MVDRGLNAGKVIEFIKYKLAVRDRNEIGADIFGDIIIECFNYG